MKHQGIVINWNDDRGFGFVEPQGGERAFVHIKSFKSRSRRPVNGDIITYDLVRDNKNRYKAENIKFVRNTKGSNYLSGVVSGNAFIIFIAVFSVVLLASVLFAKLPVMVVGLYIVVSLLTFIAYAIDKSAAQNGSWRTKESTLHILSIVGGWPGAYFGQTKLRHKSSKLKFKRVYWVTIFLNLCGFVWLHTKEGANFLHTLF